MTPLITIAKNFISQIIVISLADRGLVQLYLMALLDLGYSIYYYKARPTDGAFKNWLVIITHASLSLYTIMLIFVNSIDFETNTKETTLGIPMGIFLLLIAAGNIGYMLVTGFKMIFRFLKRILSKRDPQRERVLAQCEAFDMSLITGVPCVQLSKISPASLSIYSPNPIEGEPQTASQVLRRFKRKTFFPKDRPLDCAKEIGMTPVTQGNDKNPLVPLRRECRIPSKGTSDGTTQGTAALARLQRGVNKIRVQRFKPIHIEKDPQPEDAPQNMEEEFMMSNSPLKRTESPRKAFVRRRERRCLAPNLDLAKDEAAEKGPKDLMSPEAQAGTKEGRGSISPERDRDPKGGNHTRRPEPFRGPNRGNELIKAQTIRGSNRTNDLISLTPVKDSKGLGSPKSPDGDSGWDHIPALSGLNRATNKSRTHKP